MQPVHLLASRCRDLIMALSLPLSLTSPTADRCRLLPAQPVGHDTRPALARFGEPTDRGHRILVYIVTMANAGKGCKTGRQSLRGAKRRGNPHHTR